MAKTRCEEIALATIMRLVVPEAWPKIPFDTLGFPGKIAGTLKLR
jgi:hypothetical protein